MSERKPIEEMIGEAFREIRMLVIFFALLDRLLAGQLTVLWTAVVVVIAIASFSTVVILKGAGNDWRQTE